LDNAFDWKALTEVPSKLARRRGYTCAHEDFAINRGYLRGRAPRLRPERTLGYAGCAEAQAHDSLVARRRKSGAIRRRRDQPRTASTSIAHARHNVACARARSRSRSHFRIAGHTGTDGPDVTSLTQGL